MTMKKRIRYFPLLLILSLLLACTALAAEAAPGAAESERAGQTAVQGPEQTPEAPQPGENGGTPAAPLEEGSGEQPVNPPETEAENAQSLAASEEDPSGTDTQKPSPVAGENGNIINLKPSDKGQESFEQTDTDPSIVLKKVEDGDRFGTISVEKTEDGRWAVTKEVYYASQGLHTCIHVGLNVSVCLILLCGVLLCGVLCRKAARKQKQ